MSVKFGIRTEYAIEYIEQIGFLWTFKRDIPAPVEAQEIFINAIEVFNTELRCQGIGSQMVQKIIEISRNERVYQVRVSVQIRNIESHRAYKIQHKNEY